MKTPIEMLQSIVDMQKENYGYGIDTHMKLSVMAKEAEAVIKNHGVSHHVSNCECKTMSDCWDKLKDKGLGNNIGK